jgi:hypothetical protein
MGLVLAKSALVGLTSGRGANSKQKGMNRQRDNKGRFVKGNDEGNRFTSNGTASENGRKGAIASNEVQKRKKLLREVLREELDKETAKGSGITKMEAVVAAVVKNQFDKPSAKGLKILTEILGEMEINVNLTQSEKPKIVFEDTEDEQ